jgi:hypothetical protein
MLNKDTARGPTIDIMLNYRPLGLVHAKASSIDDELMAIDTGHIKLYKNAEVEVTIPLPNRQTQRFTAQVVQSGQMTVLALHNCSNKTMKQLNALPICANQVLGKLAFT